MQEAVAFTSNDHPRRLHYLKDLGNVYYNRFLKTGSIHDSNQSVTNPELALTEVRGDHREVILVLNNLPLSLDGHRAWTAWKELLAPLKSV